MSSSGDISRRPAVSKAAETKPKKKGYKVLTSPSHILSYTHTVEN